MKKLFVIAVALVITMAMSVSVFAATPVKEDFSTWDLGDTGFGNGYIAGYLTIKEQNSNKYLEVEATGENCLNWNFETQFTGKIHIGFDIYFADTNFVEVKPYSVPEIPGGSYDILRYCWIETVDGTIELWNQNASKRRPLPVGEWMTLDFYADPDENVCLIYLNGEPAWEDDQGMPYIESDGGVGYCDMLRLHVIGTNETSFVSFDNLVFENYTDLPSEGGDNTQQPEGGDNTQQPDDDDNTQDNPETADHIAVAIVVAAAAAGVVLVASKRYAR